LRAWSAGTIPLKGGKIMLKSTVYSLGNPGTFDITDKDDPLYYLARIAHEQSVNLWNLSQAGLEFRQMEQSDMAALETTYDSFYTDIIAWLDSAVAASMAEDPIPALPSIPDIFPAYEVTDGSVGIWWAIIKFLLYYLLLKLKKKLEGGTDVTEVANILRKGLIGEAGGEKYSFIELLQNAALHICIDKGDHFQDITYE
jgi:hypothetical protein